MNAILKLFTQRHRDFPKTLQDVQDRSGGGSNAASFGDSSNGLRGGVASMAPGAYGTDLAPARYLLDYPEISSIG